jgi:hypothetical protein
MVQEALQRYEYRADARVVGVAVLVAWVRLLVVLLLLLAILALPLALEHR